MCMSTTILKKSVCIFVPNKMRYMISEDVIDYTYNGKEVKIKTLYILMIVSTLLSKHYLSNNKKNEKEGFALNSFILRKAYSKYNYYIDWLVKEGIFFLTQKAHSRKNSRKYRLNSNYLDYFMYNITDAYTIKKYQKVRDIYDKYFTKDYIDKDVLKTLKEHHDSITIDIDGALAYIEKYKDDAEKYKRYKYSIESIYNDSLFFKDDNYGRVHTNCTTLKKDIRRMYLSLDNLPLTEFDITNSQPTLLISLLKENLDKIDKDEFKKYVNTCKEKGGIYKKIVECTNLKIDYYLTDNKEEKGKIKGIAKEMVFKVFFGKNCLGNSKNGKYNRFFRSLFPTIYEFIVNYKKIKGGHEKLAHELQRRESKLIFNTIIKEIMEKYPGIKILTIHDSILCQTWHKDDVEKIFKKHVDKLYEID